MTAAPIIRVRPADQLHFAISVPCGDAWPGMRHTDDVRIVLDRAMDHTDTCSRCREAMSTNPPRPARGTGCEHTGCTLDLDEIDRNARAYGWEVAHRRIAPPAGAIDASPGNPFTEPRWRDAQAGDPGDPEAPPYATPPAWLTDRLKPRPPYVELIPTANPGDPTRPSPLGGLLRTLGVIGPDEDARVTRERSPYVLLAGEAAETAISAASAAAAEWIHECGHVETMPADWVPTDGGCDACESGSDNPADWRPYTPPGPPYIVAGDAEHTGTPNT